MNTTTIDISRPGVWARRTLGDWLSAAAVAAGGLFAFLHYLHAMNGYEQGILLAAIPGLIALLWFWPALQKLSAIVAGASLLAISLYQRHLDSFGVDLAQAENVFWLKYILSSQSAILWMSVLFWMATAFYWLGTVARSETAERIGSGLTWGAVTMALIGTLVRWFESHQIAPDIGHIPVSNLYEVFVLFSWLTALFYLYYEAHYRTRTLGAYVLLVVSAAVGFLLWYTFDRGAHEIQPLVPALQSWWMKIHVPANFVGYGTFALSAMVALAYLLRSAQARPLWAGLVVTPLAILALMLAFAFSGLVSDGSAQALLKVGRSLGLVTALMALAIAMRAPLTARLPSLEVLDDLMYKAIAVGFAFFTIATILGALWAAEAWGGYWSWDPKETWALIVWLNYAAWLHLRLMMGLRGQMAAWWALVGLLVTTFAFLGVNMFLSGLHSYGEL